jgi:hypothetical protein
VCRPALRRLSARRAASSLSLSASFASSDIFLVSVQVENLSENTKEEKIQRKMSGLNFAS